MTEPNYHVPRGGHPGQDALITDRAMFTTAYVVIPRGALRDIVTSRLPHWEKTRAWFLSRPLSGFAETFSQYVLEVAPGGGSDHPETDPRAEGVLFVLEGEMRLSLAGADHRMEPGGYAYIPPGSAWRLRNSGDRPVRFHWIRKAYEPVAGLGIPDPLVTSEREVTPDPMPDSDGAWTTTRFVDPEDMRHDMQVNIVTLAPGAKLSFTETHVMEHGIYVLEGIGVYRLNQDWVEVQAGDFVWLRAFCPQACYAGGPGPFRYLLYRDVNRHARLAPSSLAGGTIG